MPMDANSSDGSIWSTAGTTSRQKRVMPSRSRRGGPGLGTCEVDVLILETQRRKLENEPLIPADTPFLLTTNPKYAEETLDDSESGIQINVVANERYFDRPDVLKAFREQAIIQTPEYEAISESVSGVGGRFRPRIQEEVIETSDAAYEKRHRKFEKFEKRQRHREKEKLKHEHYKLKERIEQLKAMDGSTFMNLPASGFTPPSQEIAEDGEETTSSPYVAINGGLHHLEGERRRKEMLDVAIKLEKRYSYLLPPRKVLDTSSSFLKDTDGRDGEETDTERDSGVPAPKKDRAPKPRVQSVKSSTSTTPALSPALRPLVLKKPLFNPRTLVPVPKQPSTGSDHRTSISTSAESPEPVSPVDQKEKSPSPVIIIDDDIPETSTRPSPPPSPPTPSQPVEKKLTAPDVHSPEPAIEPQLPFSTQKDSQAAEDVSMEIEDRRRPVGMEEEEVSQPQPDPSLDMPHHMEQVENLTLADGESEKAPSGTGDTQKSPLDPLPTKKLRGRPRNIERTEQLSEIRVRLPQENVAGPSRLMQFEGISGIRLEKLAEFGLIDSISGPAPKRRRIDREETDSISVGMRSHSPLDKVLAAISASSHSVRGKTYVSYVDSRTGETVRTPSLLMFACMRAAEKTNTRRRRENISFGVPTPDFGKGVIVDYELEEEILYRDFRDKSSDGNVSVSSDEESELEEAELSHEDDDAEEQAEEGEEIESVHCQSPEQQPPHEHDDTTNSERGESGQVPEHVEPLDKDQNLPVIKVAGHNHPDFGSHPLVYQGPDDEQLIASPEAEPMLELPRPRKPYRRHRDEEEEELIWD